jgi:hypothetical protein
VTLFSSAGGGGKLQLFASTWAHAGVLVCLARRRRLSPRAREREREREREVFALKCGCVDDNILEKFCSFFDAVLRMHASVDAMKNCFVTVCGGNKVSIILPI